MHLTEVSRQKERKTQISQLKKALAALGKVNFALKLPDFLKFQQEKEVLQLENEKYQTQLDSLRDSKLDGQIKQKKEIDHLRNELRKARIRYDVLFLAFQYQIFKGSPHLQIIHETIKFCRISK